MATVSFSRLPKNEAENKDNFWPRFDRKKPDLSFRISIAVDHVTRAYSDYIMDMLYLVSILISK